MKKSNITLSIFILFLTLQIAMTFTIVYSQGQWEQTTIQGIANSYIVDVDFINSNTGFIALKVVSQIDTMIIYKTTDKGLTFSKFWSTIYYDPEFGMSFNNADTGFVFYGDDAYKIWGNYNQSLVINNSWVPSKHRIKIFENGIGYCLYGTKPSTNYLCYVRIYKTINFGNSWSIVYDNTFNGAEAILSDVDVLSSNPDSVIVVGQIRKLDGFHPQSRSAIRITSSNGFSTTHFSSISNINDSIAFDYVNFLPNGESRILANDGIYNQSLSKIYSLTESGDFRTQYGFRFINNNLGLAALNSGDLKQTTNGGYNWSAVSNIGYGISTSSQISSIGEIAYYGDATYRNLFTRRLSTDLKTYFDNQSSSGSIIFDGSSYNTPSQEFLRGGTSSLTSANIINSGQSNERIFYKWSDGFMNAYHSIGESSGNDFYFDASGTTISNYFKTKQISTISSAISNPSQSKSIRDTTLNGVTITHSIHESMGGIFYSKSTNYGATYQTEEVVNLAQNLVSADGNKNASLCIMKNYSSESSYISNVDPNRNVAVAWERYNSNSGQTEIKFARRIKNIPQTGYEWVQFDNGNPYVTSFNSNSGFESKPGCYVLRTIHDTSSISNLTVIIPHLEPSATSGQTKIVVSVRRNGLAQNYALDSGNIQSLSTTGKNYYYAYDIHFAYKKGDSITYRKETFGFNGSSIFRDLALPMPEVQSNISRGDGYLSRFTPDISIMGGVPVISYAASYNATRLVEFEDHQDYIPVTRYPIVKVHRINSTTWSNFVVYTSNAIQTNPDIEGSQDKKSYIINYSLNNGHFKKVANVTGYPGYLCQPSIFTGTDSRLINNSYSGDFGNNLSLLTLSSQSSTYKVDKQSFSITNTAGPFEIDNIEGVVNLDTIKYSFKLGPIYTKDYYESYYEIEGMGVLGPAYEEPIISGIEFNENLKSRPFLLNETQALLIGARAIYIKDNGYYSISEIPYTVNLYNKTTGLLHRILFQDTIKDQDSTETEFLRGYYITDIPNGVDSFYIQMEVDEEFNNADYFVNPIYEDEYDTEGDNSPGRRLAVIFENEALPSVNNNNIIPTEYSLSQNYPNPFNPNTKITFALPKDGLTKISVYDIAGKEIAILVNESMQAGTYNIFFNGINFASGVYFYRIQSSDFIQTKQMVLIK